MLRLPALGIDDAQGAPVHRLARRHVGNEQGLLGNALAAEAEVRRRHVGGAVGQETEARQNRESLAFADPGLDGLHGAIAGTDEDVTHARLGEILQARCQRGELVEQENEDAWRRAGLQRLEKLPALAAAAA